MRFTLLVICLLTLSGCSSSVIIGPSCPQDDRGWTKLVDVTECERRLVIYLFGSPPLLLKKDELKINGYQLDVYARNCIEPIYSDSNGEIEPNMIVDYSDFSKGILRIVTCAWDPRKLDDDVPFTEKTVRMTRENEIKICRRILLEPEPGGQAEIDKLVKEVIADNEKAVANDEKEVPDPELRENLRSEIEENLAHLRNIGIAHPDDVLKGLESLPHLAVDCCCGHLLNGFITEVCEAKEIFEENAPNNDTKPDQQ
jgi:hypothetical protein